MEDSNPLFESTCDFIERHKERRRVRAGTQLTETSAGVLIGSAYIAPPRAQSADAERIQAALLAEAAKDGFFQPFRMLRAIWRWVWR
jgi:hypothetical protein